MKYIKISYNKKIKKLIVSTLLVSVLTCGCGLKGIFQSKAALQNHEQEEAVNKIKLNKQIKG